MVTVTGFKKTSTDEGDIYIRLIIEGDLEMVKSVRTGNFYAHKKRASISCTFDETTAEQMIGKELPGNIIRQEVEEYEAEINGETMILNHRWVYTDLSDEQLAIQNLVDEVGTSNAKQNGKAKDAVAA